MNNPPETTEGDNKPAIPDEGAEELTQVMYLLHGMMPELKKMGKKDLAKECEMWRRIWNWTPDEVRYYLARIGTTLALVGRNYKRKIGILLGTHWTLDEIDLQMVDKVFDTRDGQYYFEKKVMRTKLGGVIGVEFISERATEEEINVMYSPEEEAIAEEQLGDTKASKK